MSEIYKSLCIVNLHTGKERTEILNKTHITLAADYFEFFTQLSYKEMRVNKYFLSLIPALLSCRNELSKKVLVVPQNEGVYFLFEGRLEYQ